MRSLEKQALDALTKQLLAKMSRARIVGPNGPLTTLDERYVGLDGPLQVRHGKTAVTAPLNGAVVAAGGVGFWLGRGRRSATLLPALAKRRRITAPLKDAA